jgi:hypothetical protein
MGRPWLRHPPAVLHPPLVCPSGLPRFASLEVASQAEITSAFASGRRRDVVACGRCGGAHIVPVGAEGPSVPP